MSSVNPGLVTLQLLHTTDSLQHNAWLHNLFYFCQQNEPFTIYSFDPTIHGAHSDDYESFLQTLNNEQIINIETPPVNPALFGTVQVGPKTVTRYSITDDGEKILQQARNQRDLPLTARTMKQVNRYTRGSLNEFLQLISDKYPECFAST